MTSRYHTVESPGPAAPRPYICARFGRSPSNKPPLTLKSQRRFASNTRSLSSAACRAACLHALRARAHALSAHSRTHAFRANATQPCPPCTAPARPTRSTSNASARRLSCVFRCVAERSAKQALDYVHTWVRAASASTGIPLPASASPLPLAMPPWSRAKPTLVSSSPAARF